MNDVIIGGIKYTPEKMNDESHYVIVRTYSAGVFAGYIKSRNGREIIMTDARRLWMWEGASSLSELSQKGTSKPDRCKFPCIVSKIELFDVIEILYCTNTAKNSIDSVPIWTSHKGDL